MISRAAAILAAASLLGCNGELRFDETTDAGPRGRDDGSAPLPTVDASDSALPPRTGCTSDPDCRLPTLHCDAVSATCVACANDSHCAAITARRCDTALHHCVQCGVDGDCAMGQVCQPDTHRCVVSCTNIAGCTSQAPFCDLGRSICVRCRTDVECGFASETPRCDVTGGRCVACTMDAQCPMGKPRCDRLAGACVGCLSGADCPGAAPLCDPAAGVCVSG